MAKKVLMIDDDEEYTAAITCFLEAHGYSVTSAQDGKDGQGKVGVHRGNVLIDHDREAQAKDVEADVFVALDWLSTKKLHGRQHLHRLIRVQARQLDLVGSKSHKEDDAGRQDGEIQPPDEALWWPLIWLGQL